MNNASVLFLANIISFCGTLTMVLVGFVKRKRRVLIGQCVSFTMLGVSNMMLGGATGVITNLVAVVRNLVACNLEYTWHYKVVFIILQVVFAIMFNTLGWIGWLPVVASCAVTWFLDVKTDRDMKFLIIATSAPWIYYDFYLKNYTAFVFDFINIGTNCVGLFLLRREAKKNALLEAEQTKN